MLEQFIKGACDEFGLDEKTLSTASLEILKQAYSISVNNQPVEEEKKKSSIWPWLAGAAGVGGLGALAYSHFRGQPWLPGQPDYTPSQNFSQFMQDRQNTTPTILRDIQTKSTLPPAANNDLPSAWRLKEPKVGPTTSRAQDLPFAQTMGVTPNSWKQTPPSGGLGDFTLDYVNSMIGRPSDAWKAWEGQSGNRARDAARALGTSFVGAAPTLIGGSAAAATAGGGAAPGFISRTIAKHLGGLTNRVALIPKVGPTIANKLEQWGASAPSATTNALKQTGAQMGLGLAASGIPEAVNNESLAQSMAWNGAKQNNFKPYDLATMPMGLGGDMLRAAGKSLSYGYTPHILEARHAKDGIQMAKQFADAVSVAHQPQGTAAALPSLRAFWQNYAAADPAVRQQVDWAMSKFQSDPHSGYANLHLPNAFVAMKHALMQGSGQ